ncbi:ELM1/GtrOC1 family putative glycosyltransferase [Sphingomonas sp.]|uniref:ELM1/GtrOC1 family putative glycosyltransferase n=1 Tax=Sphingomonas sp. TaxID=28214 RepID=UPI00286AF46E|nr:ELM1/GtrOC1 family putative glycosyltransferase [Sphingomonas sp.]
MTVPLIWVLVGSRTGDNNQVLALAETVGLPFTTVHLDYNLLRSVTRWLGPTRASLDRKSKARLTPPWPDLVIGIGRRSVPVSRWIREQNRGKTKIVLLGNPRIDPSIFDLVITTRQYPVPPGDNVVLLDAALSRFQQPPEPDADEQKWLAELPRPLRVVAIGGATKYWRLSTQLVSRALITLRAKPGGSLIIVTSRRTNPEIIEKVRSEVHGAPNERLVEGRFPRFAMLLGQADEIHVTADSISMISEAILARKKVGLIPIDQNNKGRRKLGPEPRISGRDARRRDLRRFWHYLRDQKVIGTVEEPLAATIANPNDIAATALKALLPIDAGSAQPR